MPTIISHTAVPLALRLGAGSVAVPGRLLAAAVLVSALPDLDVVGFSIGISYGDPLGHRGFAHSLVCAALVAGLGSLAARWFEVRRATAFLVLVCSMASHGIADAFTDGGLGVALLAPFSNERFFFPWRPIHVSPIGVGHFWRAGGAQVLASELVRVWLPCLAVGVLCFAARRRRERVRANRVQNQRP